MVSASAFPNLRESTHPLVRHKVTQLSDRDTGLADFQRLVRELTQLLLYEATASLPIRPVPCQTPLEATSGVEIDGGVALVAILRAGLGMLDGARLLLPDVTAYHLGIYRNEATHEPVSYYDKLPRPIPQQTVIVLDPMLATGGTLCAATDSLKRHGAADIRFVGLVAAPEGVRSMLASHPEVPLHVARLDRELSPSAYILPGLGDAGDRLYGTNP